MPSWSAQRVDARMAWPKRLTTRNRCRRGAAAVSVESQSPSPRTTGNWRQIVLVLLHLRAWMPDGGEAAPQEVGVAHGSSVECRGLRRASCLLRKFGCTTSLSAFGYRGMPQSSQNSRGRVVEEGWFPSCRIRAARPRSRRRHRCSRPRCRAAARRPCQVASRSHQAEADAVFLQPALVEGADDGSQLCSAVTPYRRLGKAAGAPGSTGRRPCRRRIAAGSMVDVGQQRLVGAAGEQQFETGAPC